MDIRIPLAVTALAIASACLAAHSGNAPALRPLESPAGDASQAPHLATGPDGTVYLGWLQPAPDGGHVLSFSTHSSPTDSSGHAWSEPRRIVAGENFFVNWADVPSLTVHTDGTLAAHWLAYNGSGTYAYGVRVSFSSDGGETWTEPTRPHSDTSPTEHGFVSMVPRPGGSFLALWLDGRDMAVDEDAEPGHGRVAGAMTLRAAGGDPGGGFGLETVVDERVCECCPTSAAAVADGVLAAYRDRGPDELREIHVVRHTDDGGWQEPQRLSHDGWVIPGCPVNGPAVATDGNVAAVAWFNLRDGRQPLVQVAFSDDSGRSFGTPVRVDEGTPLGRVDAVLLPDGAAVVAWMENVDRRAHVMLRRVAADGTRGAPVSVAVTGAARSSGHPRIVRTGDRLVVAWTDTEQRRVATGWIPIEEVR